MTLSPEVEVPFAGDDVVVDYIEKYSNWGRWGADDELGTLNHVGRSQTGRRRSTIGPLRVGGRAVHR